MGQKNILKIMAESFSELIKDTKPQILGDIQSHVG